jgi:hypothetical protein
MPGFGRFGSPNKTLTIAVGIVLLLVAGWVVAAHSRTNVAEDLSRQVQSGAAEVDMAHLTNFDWDEIFVFGPYYPKDAICKTLNLTASHCSEAGINDVDEGEFLLVFTDHGTVSKTVQVPRTIANFDESKRCLARPIPRSAAVFRVERKPAVYLVCR